MIFLFQKIFSRQEAKGGHKGKQWGPSQGKGRGKIKGGRRGPYKVLGVPKEMGIKH